MREPLVISEQDRLDAVHNLRNTFATYPSELELLAELDKHRLMYDHTKNLGYYRTFYECLCGAGFWCGTHEGDPSWQDRWDAHRIEVVAALEERERR